MARFKGGRAAPPKPNESFANVDEALRAVVGVLNAHDEELRKLNGGLSLATNTEGEVRELDFEMPRGPTWRTDVFTRNVNVLGSVLAVMEPGGLVTIRGGFEPSPFGLWAAGIPAGANLGTFATGWEPDATEVRPAVCETTKWATVQVTAATRLLNFLDGAVLPTQAVGVDGLKWWAGPKAAPPTPFSGRAWPLIVKYDLKRPCVGLMVMGFRLLDKAGQNEANGAPVVDWQDLGNGSLRINSIWGLQWGQRYKMRVYLTPEDQKET